MNNISEDIEILEDLLEEGFEAMCYLEAHAIENLINRLKEDEAVIEEMARMMVKVPNSVSDVPMTAVVKATINRNLELHKMKFIEYVRNKVKENKDD